MLRQVLDDAAAQQQQQQQEQQSEEQQYNQNVNTTGMLDQPELLLQEQQEQLVPKSNEINSTCTTSIAQNEPASVAQSTANLTRQLQIQQQQQQQQEQQKLINNGRNYGSIQTIFESTKIVPTSSNNIGKNSSSVNGVTPMFRTITPKKSILKTDSKIVTQQQDPDVLPVVVTVAKTTVAATEASFENVKSHRRSLTSNDAYNAPINNYNVEYTNDYSDEDDDDDDEEEDDDDEDGIVITHPVPWYEKIRNSAISLFLVVADVENLWDSPERNETVSVPVQSSISPSNSVRKNRSLQQETRPLSKGGKTNQYQSNRNKFDGGGRSIGSNHSRSNSSIEVSNHPYDTDEDDDVDDEWMRWYKANRRRNNTIVLFWFVVLAASYATERSTFKLLVDNVEPFRLISAQYVTLFHAILLSIGIALERWYTSSSLSSTTATTTTTTSSSNNTSPTQSTSAAGSPQQTQSQSQMFTTTNNRRQQFNGRRGRRQQHEHNIQDQQFAMWKLPLGIPYGSVVVMALLDSISLLSLFLSGSHVAPLCTVILIQFTIPLTAFLTQFIHPDGRFHCVVKWLSKQCIGDDTDTDDDEEEENDDGSKGGVATHEGIKPPPPPQPSTGIAIESIPYQNQRPVNKTTTTTTTTTHQSDSIQQLDTSTTATALPGYGGLATEHVWGSVVLALAVLFALIPALYSLVDPDYFTYADTVPIRTAVNTLVYVSSCFPAAASQLYKEHVFIQHRQPVNINYLNVLLSLLQLIIAIIVSPLLFTLQGLSSTLVDDWTTLYPSNQYRENYIDSLRCLFNVLNDNDQIYKYAEDAQCKYAFVLVLLQAFSIITVGVAVDKIVNAGATKVMYRGISAGIIGATICMKFYDISVPEYNYGPIITTANFICLVLLILGSELYHRVSLQESTFETIYPEIHIQNYNE